MRVRNTLKSVLNFFDYALDKGYFETEKYSKQGSKKGSTVFVTIFYLINI